jgi:hypothetical protein
MQSARAAILGVCMGLLSGCTQTPVLYEDGIAIASIVQRVKCELAFALPEPEPPWPTGKYQWMRGWTAKVDLTLVVNEQSSVSPSAIFTRFLPNVSVPNVGNIGQSITLSAGASLGTTAIRTEILSFTVSLSELRRFKREGLCDLPDGNDLYGNLRLYEWISSALTPVEHRQLKVGLHPPPGAKSPPAPPVLPPSRTEAFDALAPLRGAVEAAEYYANIADDAASNARRNANREDIQATYDDAAKVYGALKAVDRQYQTATTEANKLKDDSSLQTAVAALITDLGKSVTKAKAAKTTVDALIDGLPHDPPIDSLAHSVQFIVAISGNVTPSWTLVNFKGPGANGSLLAGSHTATHTLNIAMGSPAGLTNEQTRQLNNLVILQTLTQPQQH